MNPPTVGDMAWSAAQNQKKILENFQKQLKQLTQISESLDNSIKDLEKRVRILEELNLLR